MLIPHRSFAWFCLISLAGFVAAAGCGERFSTPGSGGAGGDSSQSSSGSKASSGNTGGGGGDNTSSSPASTGVGGGDCTQEVCNGEDDDCDNTIDEGCPTGVSLTGHTFNGHNIYGTQDGPSFSDECLPGSAIFRISGHLDDGLTPASIERLQARCAMLELNESTDSIPFEYSITRGDPLPPLMSHGTAIGQEFALTCPEDEFMIGLSGFSDSTVGLQQLRIHCAELVLYPNGESYSVAHSSAISIVGDIPPFPEDFIDVLPSPKVVNRIQGFAGMWVNAVGIGEASPLLVTP